MARYWADQLRLFNPWIVGHMPPPYQLIDPRQERRHINPRYLSWQDVPTTTPDIVILAIKWRRMDWARRWITNYAPESLVVCLMNGMGQEEALSSLHHATLAIGTTTAAVTRQDDEGLAILVRSQGTTILPVTEDPRENTLREVLHKAHSNWTWVNANEMQALRWQKLTQNSVINPLTALADCFNGELTRHPLWGLAPKLVQEARVVTESLGLNIPQNMLERVESLLYQTGNNLSSMLQDVRAGLPTEIEAINGYIAREAARRDLATPTHDAIAQLITALPTSFSAIP